MFVVVLEVFPKTIFQHIRNTHTRANEHKLARERRWNGKLKLDRIVYPTTTLFLFFYSLATLSTKGEEKRRKKRILLSSEYPKLFATYFISNIYISTCINHKNMTFFSSKMDRDLHHKMQTKRCSWLISVYFIKD
jgi:hypothetical protein